MTTTIKELRNAMEKFNSVQRVTLKGYKGRHIFIIKQNKDQVHELKLDLIDQTVDVSGFDQTVERNTYSHYLHLRRDTFKRVWDDALTEYFNAIGVY